MLEGAQLIEYQGDLERGAILRCKGKYPYEEYVDFMLTEYHENAARQYALVVISGYKAGSVYVVFPEESVPKENSGYALDITWLRDNWGKWGYFDCPLTDVYLVCRKSPVGFSDF
jgi:hypothetical protein